MRRASFSLVSATNTIQEALRTGVLALQKAHVESASLDARLLLEHVQGCTREQLLLSMDMPMAEKTLQHYRRLIDRRAAREPVAKIIGRKEFWGMLFKVSSETLDPRPDSETLVETVLRHNPNREQSCSILDLGTGTGCLLLTLLNELPHATGLGVDCHADTLAVARDNALTLGLQSRANFIMSDWCSQVAGTFDIVVANPPYIPTRTIETLSPEVARFDPMRALDGGEDGLDAYRAICSQIDRILAPAGLVAFEMGTGQQASLTALIEAHGLTVVDVASDLGSVPRVVVARKRQE